MHKVNLLSSVWTTGQSLDVAAQGNYAYVANDFDGLRIYDITDPGSPTSVLDKALYAGGRTSGVTVAGVVCATAANALGILLWDVTIPQSPTLLARIAADVCGMCFEVKIVGTNLYSSGSLGTHIWNITDPTHPVLLSTMLCEGQLCVDGTRLYVANGAYGLWIYDVLDKTRPLLLRGASADLPYGYACDVTCDDQYVVVALREDGVTFYDKATLAEIAHVVTVPPNTANVPGQWPIDGQYGVALCVALFNGRLLVSNFGRGLTVYNIANLNAITEVETIPSVELPCRLAIHRDFILWANGMDGLRLLRGKYGSYEVTYTVDPNPIVDGSVTVAQGDYDSAAILAAGFPSDTLLENQTLPSDLAPYRRNTGSVPPYLMGRICDGGLCRSVLFDSAKLYVANDKDSVRIYDFNGPLDIEQTHRLYRGTGESAHAVFKVVRYGNYLYALSATGMILVWDVSAEPPVYTGVINGFVVLNGLPTDAVLSGSYLIVSTNRGGLLVLNLAVSVPTAVTYTWVATLPEYPIVRMRKFGVLLFCCMGSHGINVYDTTTMSAPILRSTIPVTDARDCWYRASDKTLFIANGDLGLDVYDLTSTAFLLSLHTELLGGACVCIKPFSDRRVCVSTWARVLDVDVSTRTTPIVLGEFDCGQYINEMHVVNGVLYAVCQDGIKIYGNTEVVA
jgi:hypothetical protein